MTLRKVNKRVLTKEGSRYKTETKTFIAQKYPQALKFFQKNKPYTILTEVTFPSREDLYCLTWPEKTENRYKTLDASNRIKLFEDAFAEATGLDDSHSFFYGVGKYWATGKEETNLWAWCPEEEHDPIHELLRNLRASCP